MTWAIQGQSQGLLMARAVKAAGTSAKLWPHRAGNAFFLLPKRPGNQQVNRSQCSQTRINRSRWAGGSWAAPAHVGTLSPALCDQSCIILLALRQQLLLLCWKGPALASWPRPPQHKGTWLPALCLGKGGSSHAAGQWAEEGNVCRLGGCLAFPGGYLGCVTVAKSMSLPCFFV